MDIFNKIMQYSKRPLVYESGTIRLWEDEHISRGMLQAHIDPNEEAASRKHDFIDESVEWLTSIAPPDKFPKLLDLGCGPGMYSARLYKKGYDVTGVDISANSIDYAKRQAEINGDNINYRVENYLNINETDKYDIAILIYCDYGALSEKQRNKVLSNIHKLLKSGGILIFDVFTPENNADKSEKNTWFAEKDGGFFKATPYLCLQSHMIYGEYVTLDRYIIIDDNDNVDTINVWDCCFTEEILKQEITRSGFKIKNLYADVTGRNFALKSKTMAIVAQK